MFAGGFNSTQYAASVETFDSAVNTWTSAAPLIGPARVGNRSTLLQNNTVLVTGGYTSSGCCTATSRVDVYSPTANAWSVGPSMANQHAFHTSTLLTDGRVLVAGGTPYDSRAEIYDPSSNTWSFTQPAQKARKNHFATLLADGRV
jgi:N-acetylneuraminic acid mutarotase